MADKKNQEHTKEYLVHKNFVIDKGFKELNGNIEQKISDNRKLLNTPRLKSIEDAVPEVLKNQNTSDNPFGMMKENSKSEVRLMTPDREVNETDDRGEIPKCVGHYSNGGYICRDVMNAVFTEPMKPAEAFYLCNAFKYLWRCQHKGQYINDIKKVHDYMGYILQMYENGLGSFQEIPEDEE